MGIAMPVGAQRPALCAGFRSRQAHIGSLERPSPRSVTALQAAFRTSTGSSRSASRYSTRNGRSIGPSPGLPRGGGIAEKCDGVRGQTKPRSYYRDGPGARRTALRGSTCARRESDPGCDPGLYAPQRPAIPIAALNLKAEATARFPDGCQLVDFELLRL